MFVTTLFRDVALEMFVTTLFRDVALDMFVTTLFRDEMFVTTLFRDEMFVTTLFRDEKFVTTFSLTRVQTNGATDWEFFTMGKEAYLVVANAYNYGSQNYLDIDNYATNSTIYKLNTVKRVFEKYQSIPTYRCVAVRCDFEIAVRTGS